MNEEKSRRKSTPIRVTRKHERLIKEVQEERDISSKKKALRTILDDAEDVIIDKIKDRKELFIMDVSDSADKYLAGNESLLAAKFRNIMRNSDGDVSYINEMFGEILDEITGGNLDPETEKGLRELEAMK